MKKRYRFLPLFLVGLMISSTIIPASSIENNEATPVLEQSQSSEVKKTLDENENEEKNSEPKQVVVDESSEESTELQQIDETQELDTDVSEKQENTSIADEIRTEKKEQSSFSLLFQPVLKAVDVGQTVKYKLDVSYLATSGIYDSHTLVVSLPESIDDTNIVFNQSLEDIGIHDRTPSYIKEKNQLVYSLDGLDKSFNQSIIIEVKTINGIPFDQKKLNASIELFKDEESVFRKEADEVILLATKNISVTNKVKKITTPEGETSQEGLRILDKPTYGLGFSINKYEFGSIRLKSNSDIVLKYMIPEGARYISNNSGLEPDLTSDGKMQTLTWTWNVINLDESDTYYAEKEFEVAFEITDTKLSAFSKFDTTATITANYDDNKSLTQNAVASNYLLPDKNSEKDIESSGTLHNLGFFGPLDEEGGIQSPGKFDNEPPEVFGQGILRWNIFGTPNSNTSPIKRMHSYDLFFHPDEKLNVDKVHVGDVTYRPNSKFKHESLGETVYVSLSILYEGSESWQPFKSGLQPGNTYDLNELGIDNQRSIQSVWIHFYKYDDDAFTDTIGKNNDRPGTWSALPPGITIASLNFDTSVKPGSKGKIKSNMGFASTGYNMNNTAINPNADYVSMYYNIPEPILDTLKMDPLMKPAVVNEIYRYAMCKSADLIEPAEGINRVIQADVQFEGAHESLITEGKHDIVVTLKNDASSLAALKGPFKGYLLLPEGVEVTDTSTTHNSYKIVEENYQGSGRKLLEITFAHQSLIVKDQAIQTRIPVNVTHGVPQIMSLDFYGYLVDDFELSSVSEIDDHFIWKVEDVWDFNGNGDTKEMIFHTRRFYANHTNALYYGTALLKGQGSDEFVKTLKHTDNKDITYRVQVNNLKEKAITHLKIIGTLPHVGDRFYLTDADLGSTIDYKLTGPIQFDPSIASKLMVSYTEDDIQLVDQNLALGTVQWIGEREVKDWGRIKSFLITKRPEVSSIYEKEFNIDLTLNTLKLTDDQEDIAFLKFVLEINEFPPIETMPAKIIRIAEEKKPEETKPEETKPEETKPEQNVPETETQLTPDSSDLKKERNQVLPKTGVGFKTIELAGILISCGVIMSHRRKE